MHTDKSTDEKASTRQPVESTQIERAFNVTSKTGAVMHVYAKCTEDAMEIAKSVGLAVAKCCENTQTTKTVRQLPDQNCETWEEYKTPTGRTEKRVKRPQANQPQAQHSPLRQVTVAEYGTFFALKNGSETLATSPIREPLDALAHAYNHAEALAEALRILNGCAERGLDQSATHDGLSNCKAIADAREALARWEGK